MLLYCVQLIRERSGSALKMPNPYTPRPDIIYPAFRKGAWFNRILCCIPCVEPDALFDCSWFIFAFTRIWRIALTSESALGWIMTWDWPVKEMRLYGMARRQNNAGWRMAAWYSCLAFNICRNSCRLTFTISRVSSHHQPCPRVFRGL